MSRTAKEIQGRGREIIGGRDRRGTKDLYHENPEIAKIALQSPYVFEEERPKNHSSETERGIRFNQFTGALYIPSLRPGKSSLADRVVRKRTEGKGEESIRWAPYNSIEALMRATIYASHNYRPGGQYRVNAERFMGHVDELIERFDRGEISRENIDEVLLETIDVFDHVGFGNPQRENKKDATRQAIKALDQDSLGRFPNKLISQTRLASAWVKGLHEFLRGSHVVGKYEQYFDALASERLTERLAVAEVIGVAEKAIDTDGAKLRKVVAELKDVTTEAFRVDLIKAAPYRVPALIFNVGLFGFDADNIGLDRNDPQTFIDRMMAATNHNSTTLLKEPREWGTVETVFDLGTLDPRERVQAVHDRIHKYLPALQIAFEEGGDWTKSVSGKLQEILAIV